LQSLGKVVFPCYLAGKKCSIETDVIDSDIPLLLSKTAMKRANMKLDLSNDEAEIYGQSVTLQSTSAGHYCVPLKNVSLPIESCCTVANTNVDLVKIITKLHKQFAHPSAKRLKSLLRDAQVLNNEANKIVDDVTSKCTICIKFKKTPPRPNCYS